MGRVEGKVAIVTGAAKGIGESAARLLAGEGAKVVITDLDVASGEAFAASIDPTGENVLFIQQDVTDEAGWTDVIAQTLEKFGKLDVLVNNAGIGLTGSAEDTTLDQWRLVQAVNLDAVFLGTRAAIGPMKENGGGSIINLASIEGIIGDPNLAAYNASKGGVRIFTKSAALHCAKTGTGIRVNSVHPGYIWTPMVEAVAGEGGDEGAGRKALESLHPIGRLGRPEEIGYGILFLASDESSFMTGSELVIDGGYTAQ